MRGNSFIVRVVTATATGSWVPRMPVALGDRGGFEDLEARAYVSHCAISPVSRGVRDAVAQVLLDYARLGIGAFMAWHERREGLRRLLADLIGANAADIGFVANTTTGVSTIAQCYPWRSGDTVLAFRGEFPTNVTPWQQAARAHGLQVDFLDAEDFRGSAGTGLQRLESRLARGDVRLVAASAVQFQTGLRMPIAAMSALSHRHGAELFCDAIQAVGVLDVDVSSLGADYLVAGSHKWLMGLEGCAFLYVAPSRIAGLVPNTAGWLSHEEPVEFLFAPGKLDYQRPIRRRTDFVEAGAYATMQLAALETSTSYIAELGVPVIERHVSAYLDRVEAGALTLGFSSLRSELTEQRSGILGLRPPSGVSLDAVQQFVAGQGIVTTVPDGVLRIAPHWPNALNEADDVLSALRDALVSP